MSDGFVKVPILRDLAKVQLIHAFIEGDGVICGGYARYVCSPAKSPEKAGDCDIYPLTSDSFEKLKAKFMSLGYSVRHENEMSLTFKKPVKGEAHHEFWRDMPVIQIIKPVDQGAVHTVGSVEHILSNFDFTVARIAVISTTDALADESFLSDEAVKRLVIRNIHCPVSSLLRCMKYARRGYHMRPSQAIKLFNDWSDRDEDYRIRLIDLFKKSEINGDEEDGGKMSQKEIDELEALLRID